MLGSLGLPEILFILVLALLVFGPKRLPKVGRTLGRALGEFRRATTDLKHTIDREINAADLEEDPAPSRPKLTAVDPPSPPESSGRASAIDPGAAVAEPPEAPVARTELAAED